MLFEQCKWTHSPFETNRMFLFSNGKKKKRRINENIRLFKKPWGLTPTDFCGWSKKENKNVLASPFSGPYLCAQAPADWGWDNVLSHVCRFHYVPGTCRISECTETNWAEFQVITLFFPSLHLFQSNSFLPVGGALLNLGQNQPALPSECTYIFPFALFP